MNDKEYIAKLESALSSLINIIQEYHVAVGGCDHDTNICLCGERAELETAISLMEYHPSKESGMIILDDLVHEADPWNGFIQPSGTTNEIMNAADSIRKKVEQDRAVLGYEHEPEIRWIPCSERLPDKNSPQEPLIVIVKNKDGNEYMRYPADFDGGRFVSLSGNDISSYVVAWLCGIPEYHP